MPNIIDDLFQWAGGQPATNITGVHIAITSNEITRENLVSYAEGVLFYHPGKSEGWFHSPPSFISADDQVTQYFSDRRYNLPVSLTPIPFAADKTDPLTVSITQALFASDYTITLKSSLWGFTESFTPSFDAASSVIYASVGGGLVTVSLCQRDSQPGLR